MYDKMNKTKYKMAVDLLADIECAVERTTQYYKSEADRIGLRFEHRTIVSCYVKNYDGDGIIAYRYDDDAEFYIPVEGIYDNTYQNYVTHLVSTEFEQQRTRDSKVACAAIKKKELRRAEYLKLKSEFGDEI